MHAGCIDYENMDLGSNFALVVLERLASMSDVQSLGYRLDDEGATVIAKHNYINIEVKGEDLFAAASNMMDSILTTDDA